METLLNTIVKCTNPKCQGMMLAIDASMAEDGSLICSFCKSKVEVMPDEDFQEKESYASY